MQNHDIDDDGGRTALDLQIVVERLRELHIQTGRYLTQLESILQLDGDDDYAHAIRHATRSTARMHDAGPSILGNAPDTIPAERTPPSTPVSQASMGDLGADDYALVGKVSLGPKHKRAGRIKSFTANRVWVHMHHGNDVLRAPWNLQKITEQEYKRIIAQRR
jgi:hypothetical protein